MRRDLLVCVLLSAAVAAVYWPVHAYPFVNIDDHRYVYDNPLVRGGLTRDGIRHAFCGVTQGNWHPLTNLSHMLDCQLFGVEEGAGEHHLVNLLLHLANTLLLFVVLRRMTGAVWRSAIVAALFGLHPLHVESVAWISERKDVLSTFFFMLTLLAYHRYTRRPGVLRYLPVALLLALGLMAKPMLVTLPLVLLLLDYWPLARFGRERPHQPDAQARESLAARPALALRASEIAPLVVEKIPLLLLAAASCVVTYLVQQASGAMGMLGPSIPLPLRLANAVLACGRYLEKSFWPSRLTVLYPYVQPRAIDVLITAAVLAAMSVAAFRLARERPYLAVGWYWYLGTLVPVLGLVQVGSQAMADRYTYIPLIGIFILAAWSAGEVAEEWPRANRAAAALVVLAALGLLARAQVTHWSSSEELYRHAAECSPENYQALYGWGLLLWQEDRLDEAEQRFEEALKISDQQEPIHRALGVLHIMRQQPDEARKELERAIQLQPQQPEAYRHLAWMLATYPDAGVRDGAEAVELAEKACKLAQYDLPEYWDTLAAAQAEAGRYNEAGRSVQKAVACARRTGDEDLLGDIEHRAALYAAGQPYHAPPQRPKRL